MLSSPAPEFAVVVAGAAFMAGATFATVATIATAATAAATEVHELLQDINAAANLTPSPSRGGSGTPNSSLNSIKLREVAIDLAGIFIKLGYPDKNVKAVYSVIGQKEKESRL